MFELKGKIALVTGAGRGIGPAIALALPRAAGDVAVNYVADAGQAEPVAIEIREMGRRDDGAGGRLKPPRG